MILGRMPLKELKLSSRECNPRDDGCGGDSSTRLAVTDHAVCRLAGSTVPDCSANATSFSAGARHVTPPFRLLTIKLTAAPPQRARNSRRVPARPGERRIKSHCCYPCCAPRPSARRCEPPEVLPLHLLPPSFTHPWFQCADARKRNASPRQHPGESRQARHGRQDGGGRKKAAGSARAQAPGHWQNRSEPRGCATDRRVLPLRPEAKLARSRSD